MVAIRKAVVVTATLLIFFLMEPSDQIVNTVEANPFFIYHQIDPLPGTIPPKIAIISPQNNQKYYSENIIINFNVSKPKLDTYHTAIIEVDYTLDDKAVQAFSIWRGGSSSNKAVPQFDTTFTSPSLSTGMHQLSVYAQGVVNTDNMRIFFVNSSSTVFFAIGTQPLQPSPAPTITPLTSSNSTIASNYLPFSNFIAAVLTCLGLFAIIATIIIYKRRKPKTIE